MRNMVWLLRQAAAGERRRATAQLARDAADHLVILTRLLEGSDLDEAAEFLARTWGFAPPPGGRDPVRADAWDSARRRARAAVDALVCSLRHEAWTEDPARMVYREAPLRLGVPAGGALQAT